MSFEFDSMLDIRDNLKEIKKLKTVFWWFWEEKLSGLQGKSMSTDRLGDLGCSM